MDLLYSSDEEFSEFSGECHMEYWNDWQPSQNSLPVKREKNMISLNMRRSTYQNSSTISTAQNHKFGNWIPPLDFHKFSLAGKRITSPKREIGSTIDNTRTIDIEENVRTNPSNLTKQELEVKSTTEWNERLNLDWGKRVELHNVIHFTDGDLFWGIVNLGIFCNIKLWVNEYGNISGWAEGKASKIRRSEAALICITNTQLLQKMLSVSNTQWSSLCEILQQTKTILQFDAMVDYDLSQKTYLEKLWFFICKRRHLLPDQCMLVKLDGAVKSFRHLQITPKLVVQDIRDIKGRPVLL